MILLCTLITAGETYPRVTTAIWFAAHSANRSYSIYGTVYLGDSRIRLPTKCVFGNWRNANTHAHNYTSLQHSLQNRARRVRAHQFPVHRSWSWRSPPSGCPRRRTYRTRRALRPAGCQCRSLALQELTQTCAAHSSNSCNWITPASGSASIFLTVHCSDEDEE